MGNLICRPKIRISDDHDSSIAIFCYELLDRLLDKQYLPYGKEKWMVFTYDSTDYKSVLMNKLEHLDVSYPFYKNYVFYNPDKMLTYIIKLIRSVNISKKMYTENIFRVVFTVCVIIKD